MAMIRGKTATDAAASGMWYCDDAHCPECGCPWYGNRDYCGAGHRTCYDCLQEWWDDIDYKSPVARRELPES